MYLTPAFSRLLFPPFVLDFTYKIGSHSTRDKKKEKEDETGDFYMYRHTRMTWGPVRKLRKELKRGGRPERKVK